jgi:hypothetical protein
MSKILRLKNIRIMTIEGKWMQLEDIMLSEVIQDQKHKRGMFSLT